ncbi:MAG: hypothetical protein HYX90_07875 [Chloroflexi bacterium]|nr:hypothetical protein [Chloroflexota bacterium]
MRIYFERTGGVTGIRLLSSIDTDLLPPKEAQELADMIAAARFFDLPAVIASPATGADQFHYVVTVESGDRRHSVKAGDAAVPSDLRPLLRRLAVLAQSARAA